MKIRPLFYVFKLWLHSLRRHFKLYLTSSTERFSQNLRVVVVDGKEESEYSVKWQDFFSGHVVGECMLALCSSWAVVFSLHLARQWWDAWQAKKEGFTSLHGLQGSGLRCFGPEGRQTIVVAEACGGRGGSCHDAGKRGERRAEGRHTSFEDLPPWLTPSK